MIRLEPDELIVDGFAGGGGVSVGLEKALGRPVDIAINHNPLAMLMHLVNHPRTRHIVSDIFEADPIEVCAGRSVGLLWISPDCTYFSVARGGRPFRSKKKAERRRSLANVAPWWGKTKRPRVIILENVKEFEDWGPLLASGLPCKERMGLSFRRFVKQLRNLGYQVEWRSLKACDYGAPTSRERLFLVARCDGLPIGWPEPTHGPGRAHPWRTAAECIDWSIPCPSIFLTKREGKKLGIKRPLCKNTRRRIARGVIKFVIESGDPFIVPITHSGDARVHGIHEPLRTTTTAKRGEHALIVPTLIQTGYGERKGQAPRVPGLDKPLGTVVGSKKHALVTAFLAKHYGGHYEGPGATLGGPLHTVTKSDHHALVAGHLVKLKGSSRHGQSIKEPLHTVAAGGNHFAQVQAFLIKFYGEGGGQLASLADPMDTTTRRHRLGIVTVHGEDYAIVDIGMRMLTPRELFNGNGFPKDYIIAPWVANRLDKRGRKLKPGPLSAEAQVDMCGNCVPPAMAEAMARAQFEVQEMEVAA